MQGINSDKSSFFVITGSSRRIDTILVSKICDSTQRCLVEMELVTEDIPRH